MATFEKRIPKADGSGWDTVPKPEWGKRHPGAQWRVKVRRRGFPHQTATFTRKTDAEAWARKTEEEMRQGRHFGPQESKRRTFADLCDRYGEDVLPQKSESTQKTQRAQLAWFKRQLGHLLLRDVSTSAVDEALRKRAKTPYRGKLPSPTTVNRWHALVSHLLSMGVSWGWLEDNPSRRLQKNSEPRGRANWLADEARGRLLTACADGPDWLAPAVVVLMGTGLRLGELQRLRWGDVDLSRRGASVTIHQTKNDKRRKVPLAGDAFETLRKLSKVRRLDDDHVFPGQARDNFYRAWYAALARAEKTGGPILGEDGETVRPHDLRHTCASLMVMSGASLATVAAVLGHSQIQITMRYAHLSPTHNADAMTAMAKRFELDPRKAATK